MALFGWALSKAKTFTVWDFGALKICLVAGALMVAKLSPVVLMFEWYWYALVFLATWSWLIVRLFRKVQP
jgi:hypothetical protein